VRTGHTTPGLYEIRVQGRLESRWAAWFDGLAIASEPGGITVISGSVLDQAALHGLLHSLRDLGLPLISVTQPQGEAPEDPPRRGGTTDAEARPQADPAGKDAR
jgi:hypothetical protein